MDKRAEVIDAALEEYLLAHRDALAELFSEAQRAVARNDVASLVEIASGGSRRRARVAVDGHGDLTASSTLSAPIDHIARGGFAAVRDSAEAFVDGDYT